DPNALSLHDALPILLGQTGKGPPWASCPLCPARIVLYHHESTIIPQQFLQGQPDVEMVRIWPQLVGQYRSSSILLTRKDGVGTRSEEHTSELQSRFE